MRQRVTNYIALFRCNIQNLAKIACSDRYVWSAVRSYFPHQNVVDVFE